MTRFFHARHGKTHCPGGSDPLPCLQTQIWRGRAENVEMISGQETLISWTTFQSTSNQIFTTTGATPSAVNLMVPGTYAISAYYDFGTGIGFDDNELYWIAVQDLWSSADTLYQDRSGWAQLGDLISLNWTRTYPPLGETVAPTAAVAIIRVYVGQVTGSTNSAFPRLEIAFMGALHPDIEPYS